MCDQVKCPLNQLNVALTTTPAAESFVTYEIQTIGTDGEWCAMRYLRGGFPEAEAKAEASRLKSKPLKQPCRVAVVTHITTVING